MAVKRTRFRAAVWSVAVSWTILLIWLGADLSPIQQQGYHFTQPQSDYYNLLVDGLLQGHTYLTQTPHPDLLSPDLAIRKRAPFLLDAALFHGRYYLYYGITPAVTLLLPYTFLTGHHLSLNVACLLFALGGLYFSCLWIIDVSRRFQTEDRFLAGLIAAALVTIVPATTWLVRRAQFYDLPIAAGYACSAALIFFLWRALAREKPARWLALASLSFGLAVGSRANLILSGAALAAVFLSVQAWRRDPRLWIACFLPAAGVGAALAAYNQARFGSVVDFGFSHGLNPFFGTSNPLFSWRFIAFNFDSYFLKLPALSPRFPFVFPISSSPPPLYSNAESLVGFFPITLLVIWVGLGALLGLKPASYRERIFGLGLLLILGTQLAFMLPLGIRAYRYAIDFLTPLAGLLAWLSLRQNERSPALRGMNVATVLLIIVAALHSTLGSIELFDLFRNRRNQEFLALEKRLTPSRATLERFGAPPPSAMEFTVTFHQPSAPTIVPLTATGLPQAFDLVNCIVDPTALLEIEVQHQGFGGPRSAAIPIEWDRPYTLFVSLGSFYPRAEDNYFKAFTPGYASLLKSTALVQFNGVTVINRQMNFYESVSWVRRPEQVFGAPRKEAGNVMTVSHVVRQVVSPARLPLETKFSAIFDLDLQLPDPESARNMPVLQAGTHGAGTLVMLCPTNDGRYQFKIDQWGHRYLTGTPFSFDVVSQHNFKILVGPSIRHDQELSALATADEKARLGNRLVILFDGRLVDSFEINDQGVAFDQLAVGANTEGFSGAEPAFPNQMRKLPIDDGVRRLILKAGASDGLPAK